MDQEPLKKAVGYRAASLVEKGMRIGLGTGSTVKYFIEKLIERNRTEHLHLQVIASSQESFRLAQAGNLPFADPQTLTSLDLTVDGADEIDPQKRMIKGGGGALLREKMLASISRELVIIIDESKLVSQLGVHKLPIEVIPFACHALLHHIQKLGFLAEFRKEKSGSYYITDNGNYIIDIRFKQPLPNPESTHALLKEIPGVIETGFFFHLAGRVIIAFQDGQVLIKT